MLTKQEIRYKQKLIRNNLDIYNLSKKIIENLFKLDCFIFAKNIFTYISFGDEIDTSQILKIQDKKIFVPKIINNEMYMTEYTSNYLELNKYGILEPKNYVPVMPKEDDIIIIPALAVDKNFNRLGYGGGYYDKYLQYANGVKIVLLPEALFVEDLPIEKYDIPVDIIVTECKICKDIS